MELNSKEQKTFETIAKIINGNLTIALPSKLIYHSIF